MLCVAGPNCALPFDRGEGSLNVKGHPIMLRLMQLKVLLLLLPTFEIIFIKMRVIKAAQNDLEHPFVYLLWLN